MARKQSPYAPLPGKMREYCLRDVDGIRARYRPVWAVDIYHAEELYARILGDIYPAAYGWNVSSVRRIVDETDETLRDIPV